MEASGALAERVNRAVLDVENLRREKADKDWVTSQSKRIQSLSDDKADKTLVTTQAERVDKLDEEKADVRDLDAVADDMRQLRRAILVGGLLWAGGNGLFLVAIQGLH